MTERVMKQRAAILSSLQEIDGRNKAFPWVSVDTLRHRIRRAMGVKAVLDQQKTRERSIITYTYTKEDEAKVETIIRRLAEQGYIVFSKSGRGIKVIKTI